MGLFISLTIRCAYSESLTNEQVIIMTYQRHPEVVANRERLKTFQALAKAEEASFNQLRYGARAYSSVTRSRAEDVWRSTNDPTVELFAKKDFGQGRSAEIFGGADYVYTHTDEDTPRSFIGIRGQMPIGGSEEARAESIRLLDRGSDILIAETAYFDAVRERLRKSTQSFLYARINRNILYHLETIEAELVVLETVARSRNDADAKNKIGAIISANRAKQRELEKSFGANLADIKQRAGIHPPELISVGRGDVVVVFDSVNQMISYAIAHDPQIKSLKVSKQSLESQHAILAGASVDVLGFVEGRASNASYPDTQEYIGTLGIAVSVPDARLQKQRLAVIDARMREVQVRIDGWVDDITLSIYQEHSLASAYEQRIADIDSNLPMREKIYRDRFARYKNRQRIPFDEVYSALDDWKDDMMMREEYAQQYAGVLGELWEYSGYYFQVLEQAGVLEEKE
jgi:hypothetical protein